MGRTATRTRRWLDMEDNSDTDSVAELEYLTWDDAGAWEFRNARGNANVASADFPPEDVPPGLVQNPTPDMTRSNGDNDENPEKCEHEEWINRKLHSPWICTNHQHGWENSDMQIYDIMDITEWYPATRDCKKKAIVCHTQYVMIV